MLKRPFLSISILVCVAIIASSLTVAEVQLRFANATHYPAGVYPQSLAIGDFDNDGHQDLAVANRGEWGEYGDVSVLL